MKHAIYKSSEHQQTSPGKPDANLQDSIVDWFVFLHNILPEETDKLVEYMELI